MSSIGFPRRLCALLGVGAVLPACGIQVAGGGPHILGPDGGHAGAADGECNAIVQVPRGALDGDYAIDITCEDIVESIEPDLEPVSPVYRFEPVEVSLATPAVFDLEYDDAGELHVAWSGPGEARDWQVLPAAVTTRTWADGTPTVRFEHNAFGYFVVVRPSSAL